MKKDDFNPIFLVGAERSGTTVLRLMLDAHPMISWLNEFEYSVDRVTDQKSWPKKEDYYDYLSLHNTFQASDFIIEEALDYPALIKSFLMQKMNRDKKKIIGATCHRHYDRLIRLFPNARFIYLLRDPRDVAKSNIGMGWAGNVWIGVNRWIKAETLWNQIKSGLNETAYIEVRYEELITNTKKILAVICEFLNTSYDERMMSYPETTTYSAPDPKLINQWKSKLTDKEISLVEAKVCDIMRGRGFELYSEDLKDPTSIEKISLCIQNKWCRLCHRIKNYGFGLVVSDFLARKLRIKNWHRNLTIQMNKKTRMILK